VYVCVCVCLISRTELKKIGVGWFMLSVGDYNDLGSVLLIYSVISVSIKTNKLV
jgi:hypothetical protein